MLVYIDWLTVAIEQNHADMPLNMLKKYPLPLHKPLFRRTCHFPIHLWISSVSGLRNVNQLLSQEQTVPCHNHPKNTKLNNLKWENFPMLVLMRVHFTCMTQYFDIHSGLLDLFHPFALFSTHKLTCCKVSMEHWVLILGNNLGTKNMPGY